MRISPDGSPLYNELQNPSREIAVPTKEVMPLLHVLSDRLATYATQQAERAITEAPGFSPFTYIRPGETRLSWMIGDLLDPQGAHGQEDAFLALFLREVGLEGLTDTKSARVQLESTTDAIGAARRIDVLIQGPQWVVGIENKPWASDQQWQVKDYLAQLSKVCAVRFCLLYLTKDGGVPSGASLVREECEAQIASGHLKLVSYLQVIAWLERCYTVCRADRVTWFMRAFHDYLRRELIGKLPKEEERMIVDTVLDASNREHLPAALAIVLAGDAIRAELKARLVSAVEARLPAGWAIYESFKDGGKLGLKCKTDADWHFGIESERRSGRDVWWYGIKCDDEISETRRRSLKKLGERLRASLPGSEPPTEWWPLWSWFNSIGEHEPKEYSNWGASVRPWVDMQSGEMADHFCALALQLHGIFRQA
jgi:PD-(D/E)XK nuclease superfamily